MSVKKFPKEDLRELAFNDEPDGYTIVVPAAIIETSRWSIHYELVFSFEGKFYKTYFSRGATESQDESPYEYEDDMVECDEVVPVQVTVTQYENV